MERHPPEGERARRTHEAGPSLGVPEIRNRVEHATEERGAAVADAPSPAALPAAAHDGTAPDHAVYVVPNSARVPELDALLEDDERDVDEERRLHDAVSKILEDKQASVRVTCAQTFCRLVVDKPREGGVEWPALDDAISALIPGETILQTEDVGERSFAYVYTADSDSHLPLAQVGPAESE